MSRSKFILLLALLFLLAVPVAVQAQSPPQPVLISAEAPQGTGTVVISDDQSLSDSLTVTMTGVTPPSEGTAYEGWLVSDDGSVKLSTGVMAVASDGTISHTFDSNSEGYTGENLIAGFSTFVITVEPVPDSDPEPSGVVVFGHSIPPKGMAHIRHLLTDWPPGSGVGILTDLKTQLDAAIKHAQLATNSDTLDKVQLHIHHVLNIIEGADGPNFDASFGNPGDGIGVLAHAQDRKHAPFAANAAADDTVIAEHAALVDVDGKNVEDRVLQALDFALKARDTTNMQLAKIYLGQDGTVGVIGSLQAARAGFDADGDGAIENIAGEGGANQAYVEAQLMATYTLEPGPPAAAATPVPPTPVPTSTPLPPPTPTPAPPQPTAPGLPGVGDEAVPLVAQLALLAAVVLLGTGGIFMVRGRRSK